MTINIEEATRSDWPTIKQIRKKVFGSELNISEKEIFDSNDTLAAQFLIKLNDNVIGTLRLRQVGKVSKIERMAILKEYRMQGYGLKSLEEIIQYCRERKIGKIILDSMYDVKSFYKKCGFVESGQIFTRVGIPHIEMYLDLQ